MSGKSDIVKGRIKEAAGALTGNEELRDEGKTDQSVGEAKQAVEQIADRLEHKVDTIIEKKPNRSRSQ